MTMGLLVFSNNIDSLLEVKSPWREIGLELKIILIKEALRQSHFNQTQAAKILGMNRGTMKKILVSSESRCVFRLQVNAENIKAIVTSGKKDILKKTVKELRKKMAEFLLIRFYGNQTKTAEKLGCNRSSLRNVLRSQQEVCEAA